MIFRGETEMKVQLLQIAHARSGDKGDTANIGLIARKPEYYPILAREVTADRVAAHFAGICLGGVERFELPNLHALNFLLHQSLGGGGNVPDANGVLQHTLKNPNAPSAFTYAWIGPFVGAAVRQAIAAGVDSANSMVGATMETASTTAPGGMPRNC